MATLLNEPLASLLDAPGGTDVPAQVEALVVRMASLALTVADSAPAAAVTRALAAGSPEAFLSAFAELLIARGGVTPGALAMLRGRIALADLLQQSGGVLRADEAQTRLGVTRATLQSWRDTKKVIALPLSDGSFGYPVAQFAPPATDLERPRPLPGIAEVLAASADALEPSELVALLATPQEALAGVDGRPRTGFGALAEGNVESVVGLIEHVVTPADQGAPPEGETAE